MSNKKSLLPKSGIAGLNGTEYLSEENKNINLKRYMHPYVHCSIIYNSQDMEATEGHLNRWMDKEDVIYIYDGTLLSHKKERNLAICDNMNGPRGYYAKWNKSDWERQILYDFTYTWNLKNKINEQI